MQQLLALWQSLDLRRRVTVVGATALTFAAVLALANLAGRPSMALLYSGLEPTRAGEVLAALDQRAVTYQIDGNAIYVDAAQRDQLRMALAAEGLPAGSANGYELLDSLTGFGTTSQMFDAAYWRAKEGELARTIGAIPQVRSARVHIAQDQGVGLRPGMPPKASVTIVAGAGAIGTAQAKAIRFLVASAVAGLSPDDVSVIDSERGLVASADEDPGGADRAATLRRNVERLLEARVGYGNAVVEVSVDTSTAREQITERKIDPDSRVAISTDTEERSSTAQDNGGSAVTVASNLPQGDASGSDRQSQSQDSETRERVNFEIAETTREILRAPGEVERLTVAVLVDGITTVDAAGASVWQERGADELEALRELVASAVGFEEARGDVITIRSLQFEPVVSPDGTEGAGAGIFAAVALDPMRLIQLAVLSAVALVLGLFVLRPILAANRLPAPAATNRLPAPAAALTGEIDDGDFVPPNMAVVSDFGGGFPAIGDSRGGFAQMAGGEGGDAVARLREMIAEREDETVAVLRGWIEAPARERAT